MESQTQTQTVPSLQLSSSPMAELAESALFKPASHSLNLEECTKLSYQRAKAFDGAYGLTVKDILYLTPKFCKLHVKPLMTLDGAAFTLLTIQCNLFVGTLAPFALKRPELQPIIQSALDFDISAQFMLTEVNHGLDARNIQTTATVLQNGDIDLHTPTPNDAKVMPPTTPRSGMPVIAIVMARLMKDNTFHGLRPFLVQLTDGKDMCKGVISK
ncbi:unnamed protein product [Penicillium salamii]|nr:unnamed protein product [Penicillium salamii]